MKVLFKIWDALVLWAEVIAQHRARQNRVHRHMT